MIEQPEISGFRKIKQSLFDLIGKSYSFLIQKVHLPVFYETPPEKRADEIRKAILDYSSNPNGATIPSHELEALMGLSDSPRDKFRRSLFLQ